MNTWKNPFSVKIFYRRSKFETSHLWIEVNVFEFVHLHSHLRFLVCFYLYFNDTDNDIGSHFLSEDIRRCCRLDLLKIFYKNRFMNWSYSNQLTCVALSNNDWGSLLNILLTLMWIMRLFSLLVICATNFCCWFWMCSIIWDWFSFCEFL